MSAPAMPPAGEKPTAAQPLSAHQTRLWDSRLCAGGGGRGDIGLLPTAARESWSLGPAARLVHQPIGGFVSHVTHSPMCGQGRDGELLGDERSILLVSQT